MKRIPLLFCFAISAFASNAQLALHGASYTQNFNSIGTGLPTGWNVYNSATASSLGTIEVWNSSTAYGIFADSVSSGCATSMFGGGSKNFASANTVTRSATCAAQQTITDRALGVHQVSQTNPTHPNLNPGAAFALELANTSGVTNLNLTFKLQSLDTTAGQSTVWAVQYGLGATPTSFTTATATGSLTTGNFVFSNNTITVNFGSALDNKTTPVWIRIVALSATTGSGGRPATAIDDVNLTWTGTPTEVITVSAQPELNLTVLGDATSDKVSFEYQAEETSYNFAIYDLAGRVLRSETLNTPTGVHQMNVGGLNLAPGMYFAKMNNGNSSSVAKFIVR